MVKVRGVTFEIGVVEKISHHGLVGSILWKPFEIEELILWKTFWKILLFYFNIVVDYNGNIFSSSTFFTFVQKFTFSFFLPRDILHIKSLEPLA